MLTNLQVSRAIFPAIAFCAMAAAAVADERQAEVRASPGAEGALPEYVIGPGDVLQVFVWKEPDITRDVTVRTDGRITVPLLGETDARGRTPRQLAVELGKALGRFVANPHVTVGVAQANSARFYVIGQVMRSGEFPLTRRTTVLQGLALAGGLREFAKSDSIVIVRGGGSDERFIPVNYRRLADAKDVTQNVLLNAGDTIVVP